MDEISLLQHNKHQRGSLILNTRISKLTWIFEFLTHLAISGLLVTLLVLNISTTFPVYYTLNSFNLLLLSSVFNLLVVIFYANWILKFNIETNGNKGSYIFQFKSFGFIIQMTSILNVYLDYDILKNYQASNLVNLVFGWKYFEICLVGVLLIMLFFITYHLFVSFSATIFFVKEQNIQNLMGFFNIVALVNFSYIIVQYNYMQGFYKDTLFENILFAPKAQYLQLYCFAGAIIIFIILLSTIIKKKGFYIFVAVLIFILCLFNVTYTGEIHKRFIKNQTYLQAHCPLENYSQDFVKTFTGCSKYLMEKEKYLPCKSPVKVWESKNEKQTGCLNSEKCCPFLIDSLLAPLRNINSAMLFQTGFFVVIMYCLFYLSSKNQRSLDYYLSISFLAIIFSIILIGVSVSLYIFNVGDLITPVYHQ